MSDPGGIPELVYNHPDGRQRTRLEMDQWLRSEFPKIHWLRIVSNKLFGLPKTVAWDMREIVLRHWLLDEMVRRQLIVGDVLGVNATASHDDDVELRQLTQRLSVLIQVGQAVQPQHAEGIDMNNYVPPPPPVMGPPNGQQAPQQQSYPPGPPPPPGAPQMGPGGYAPPGPPAGPPMQPPAPQFTQPPAPQQFAQPPGPPAGAPNMTQGYGPPPGVPMGPPPGAPPMAAAPPGPPGPPQGAPTGGGRRGPRKAAPDAQPAAPQPMAPPVGGPPGAPQGFAPAGYAPQAPQAGVQMPPNMASGGPTGVPVPTFQAPVAPQQAAAPDPRIDQLIQLVTAQNQQIASLKNDVQLLSQATTVTLRYVYQKPGTAAVADFLRELGVPQ